MTASSPQTDGPRRAVTIAVAGLLIAAALLALVLLLIPKQRIAATNNISTAAFGLQNHLPEAGEVCLTGQYVPNTTAGVRMLLGTYGVNDATVRVKITDAKDAAVSSGKLVVDDPKDDITVPISAPGRTVPDARVCISSDAKIAIAGDPAGGPPSGQYEIDGENIGSTIHVDYMHEGKQSLAQMLPTIFTRASIWAPGWVGAWTFWIFLLLLPAVAGLALWQLVRLLRGDEDPFARKWLWIALAVAFVNAFAWSIMSPQLQGPDEVGHYAYTQTLVQNHDVPSRTPGIGGYGSYGNHQALAVDMAIRNILGNFDARAHWDKGYYDSWNKQDSELPDLGKAQGGAWTSASNYSPFYYVGSAVPYQVTSGSTIWTQAWAMRIWSLVLTLLTVWFCFLFGRELLPTVSWAGPAAGMIAAFEPMLMHVGSLINNDSMLFMFVSLLMYLLARILRRGITWGTAVSAGVVLAAGFLAKPTMLALFPPTAFVFGVALFSGHGERAIRSFSKRLAAIAAAGLGFVLVLLPYYTTLAEGDSAAGKTGGITSGSSFTDLLQYLWQWYLPQLPGMKMMPTTEGLPVLRIYIRGFLGDFNSLDTHFMAGWYLPAVVMIMLLLGGLVAWAWRERGQLKKWWAPAALGVIATCSLLLLINLRSWQQLNYDGKPFAQGRYLLPLISLFCAGIIAGAQGFKRWAPAMVGFAIAGLAVMNLFGYAASITRFFV